MTKQLVKHERRYVGHTSGWQEPMDTCVCGQKWPCTGEQPPSKDKLTDSALDALVENLHGYVDAGSLLHWQVTASLRELRDVRKALREAGYVGSDSVSGIRGLRLLFDAERAENEPGAIAETAVGYRYIPANIATAVCDAAYKRAAATNEKAADALRPAMLAIIEAGIQVSGVRASQPPAVWQAIDSAPKDGRHFIAIGLGRPFIGRWATGLNGWIDDTGQEREPRFWTPMPEGPNCTPLTKESAR